MKKVFTIILGILLISTLQLNAAFLKNIEKTITQPDGTVINCFSSGDEFHNWLHDKDNYTIIKSQEDGYYYYAKKTADKIVPSKYKVGTALLKSTDIEPGVNISADQWKQKRNSRKTIFPTDYKSTKAAAPEVNINQLCIYIRFSDDAEWTDPQTSTPQDTSKYFDWLNDEDPNATSMINFYKEVSYGKVEVRSHFYPQSTTTNVVSYVDTKPRGYFQPYDATTNPNGYDPDETSWASSDGATKREWNLLARVITYFNANYSVPSGVNLDHDNDEYMDNIEFFIAGDAGEWNSLLWPHNWAIQDRVLTIDGIKIFNYNFQIQEITDQRGVGVLSHEMGHALGYPDLYQYKDGSNYDPVGPWDIMATTSSIPQSFGAYTKFKYGNWISSIPEITTEGTYTLKSIDSTNNNCYKIASPYTTDEYFVLEYRKKAGRFESSIPASGLLVYRINNTVAGNGNAGGVVGEVPDEVYIYRPNGTTIANGDIEDAHYNAKEDRTAINNTSNPTPFLFNGSMGGLYISEITGALETISFKVEFKPNALYANFNASEQSIFARETVDFTDISAGSPNTWTWTFEGGSPNTYSGQNPPNVRYNTPGTYDVSLTVNDGSSSVTDTRPDYITVTELPGANPPSGLEVEVSTTNPTDAVLNWSEPESGLQTFTIQWDDGVVNTAIGSTTESDNFDALSKWTTDDLAPYDEMYITEISFYAYSSASNPTTNNYTLKIYTGTDLATLAIDQVIPAVDITLGAWNTIELDTPHQIDASVDLWFGANNNSGAAILGYPFGVDDGPAIVGKGDILYYVGDQEYYLSSWDLDYNWNMAATVVNSLTGSVQKSTRISNAQKNAYKAMEGYNIYRDDVKINTTVITETTYTDASLSDGTYSYYITAAYTAGESLASNVVNLILPDNVGIPQVEIKELSIYPNPVKDILYVELEELNNDPLSIRIYDQMGKLIYSNEITPSSDRIEVAVNMLADGAYSLLMYNTDKAYQAKFIVLK